MSNKFRRGSMAAVALVFALGASSASAATLAWQNSSSIFNGNGSSSVKILKTDAPAPIGTNVAAGAFSLTYTDTNGASNLVAWCLDITHWIAQSSSYLITSTPFSLSTGSIAPDRLSNIQKLFEVNYSTLVLTDKAQSAGFQLALWELLYENGTAGFDAGNGTFSIGAISTSSVAIAAATNAIAAANGFLANLIAPIAQSYKFTFYESQASKQNLVSVTPIPLPATMLLFGSGLLGLVAMRRRRSSADTAT